MTHRAPLGDSDLRLPRRDLLQVGALGAVGLSLPELLGGQAASAAIADRPRRAKSCILVFLEGGPSHIDLWDMKPDAPLETRGEFQPIATTLPGAMICDQMPLLARQMHRLCLVRSVHHQIVDHNAGAYYALTGRYPLAGGSLIVRDRSDNFPPFGSVLAKLQPGPGRLPDFVHVPDLMLNLGHDLPGQRAGFLGPACDPLIAGDPSIADYEVPGLSLPRYAPLARLQTRRKLLDELDRSAGVPSASPSHIGLDAHYDRAFSLLASDETRRAFDLDSEPAALRERYGLPDRDDRSIEARKFGGLPHLGQTMLLARRLIESGVRLVTVITGRRVDQAWDTHFDHFPLLKRSLVPYFDRAFSALLEDMSQRGLLDETLVIAMGEFGRTPKISTKRGGGRDHWPHCYTVMFAGGGFKPGYVYGSSDQFGGYPLNNPVTPEDLTATIYQALGIDPESIIHDALKRPHTIALGQPIADLTHS